MTLATLLLVGIVVVAFVLGFVVGYLRPPAPDCCPDCGLDYSVQDDGCETCLLTTCDFCDNEHAGNPVQCHNCHAPL